MPVRLTLVSLVVNMPVHCRVGEDERSWFCNTSMEVPVRDHILALQVGSWPIAFHYYAQSSLQWVVL